MIEEIAVAELKRRHDAGEDLLLLDVREPDEIATASIPWARAIPMAEIPARAGAKRWLRTPGLPPRAATSRPESSARQG